LRQARPCRGNFSPLITWRLRGKGGVCTTIARCHARPPSNLRGSASHPSPQPWSVALCGRWWFGLGTISFRHLKVQSQRTRQPPPTVSVAACDAAAGTPVATDSLLPRSKLHPPPTDMQYCSSHRLPCAKTARSAAARVQPASCGTGPRPSCLATPRSTDRPPHKSRQNFLVLSTAMANIPLPSSVIIDSGTCFPHDKHPRAPRSSTQVRHNLRLCRKGAATHFSPARCALRQPDSFQPEPAPHARCRGKQLRLPEAKPLSFQHLTCRTSGPLAAAVCQRHAPTARGLAKRALRNAGSPAAVAGLLLSTEVLPSPAHPRLAPRSPRDAPSRTCRFPVSDLARIFTMLPHPAWLRLQ